MSRIALTLLIALTRKDITLICHGRSLGETIQATVRENGRYLARLHPSWRNTGWLKKTVGSRKVFYLYLRKRLRIHGIERI